MLVATRSNPENKLIRYRLLLVDTLSIRVRSVVNGCWCFCPSNALSPTQDRHAVAVQTSALGGVRPAGDRHA